jgi:hypothetical protein
VTDINRAVLFWSTVGLCVAAQTASAQDPPASVEVTIEDHKFSPSEIHVQAGKPTLLEVAE